MAAGNLALYRKYRSATFAEVIGQEHVTEPLRHALANGRINHAYLFSGPRGCGKTSSARILARSLNCAQGPTPDPCGVCESCVELAPNGPGSIDVIEIDAASHGGVDDARDLRERAFFAPVRDRFKVYIIDEAHMVTTQGFNALLKLVEEPPDFLVFVFATTEPDKVLPTIRSRTHHYPFRLIPPGTMRAHLERICAAENISVEPAVLPLVVRAGGGSVRDALSLLDQLLAGAGPDGVTYARAVALLGVTDRTLLDDMVDALAAGDASGVYSTVDRVVEAGHDARRFATDLLDRFRDLILLDAVPDAAARGLIDAPQDDLAAMSDQAARLGGAALARFAEIVHTALIEMRGTTSPRLVLELLCARMLLPDASADAAAVLQRLERLERRLSAAPAGDSGHADETPAPVPPQERRTVASAPPPPSAPPAAARAEQQTAAARSRPNPPAETPAAADMPVSVPTPSSPPGSLDATALRRLWPEVLDVVKLTSRRTRALLDNAQIVDVAGELVSLSAPAALARMISEESNATVLRQALTKVVGGEWRIDVHAANGATAAPAASERRTPSAADPGGDVRREVRDDPTDDAGDDAGDDVDVESDQSDARPAPLDPEAQAMRLLQDQLGARPVEEG